ncbi:heterodisulfide reductase subunit A [Methanophagales archaeon]|nr:heterodisulfide reductase subunit A [Methanophagales archaeon]
MKIGVYICHCGTNIAATVDVEAVAKFAETLPDVAVSRAYVYMCSDPGQELIKADILDAKLDRVVVASCSPRMHEITFRSACEEAGLNAYCLEMANIREQCSWVHSDREKGTEKAKELVASAVAKAALLESLEPMRVGVTPSALIIGGGIAGIQCALDIADAGFQVYLVEKEPSVGGHMAQLDKTFPTLDCSACVLTPKMVDVARHDKIELITYATVDSVEGYVGSFKVKVKKTPRYVDEDKCTGCGECAIVCPVKEVVPNEFDLGLSKRGAVYIPFPQAIPMVYTIDKMGGIPPCRLGCPANVNVQGYVALIAQGRYREAIDLIREVNPLPAICGYVCPHPCENECNRVEIDDPIAIGALKRFAADNIDYEDETDAETEEEDNETEDATDVERAEKIAIIGSGPAGLTAAFYLAKCGYHVRILEKLPVPGGMLAVGIPEYRLPKDILKKEVEYIKREGGRIEIDTGVEIDKDGFERLKIDYKAIFVSIGADKSRAFGIEGEGLKGVVHGVEFLRELNLGNTVVPGKKVAVVGGGDVAIDAARCALRLGSDVTLVYRRSREEMPARDEEIADAEAEGVKITFLTNPSRFIGDGFVQGMECVKMELGEQDGSGRRRPVPVAGSEYIQDVDTVILAVGQQSALEFLEGSGIELEGNRIKADGDGRTNIECVFAAGDAVTGPATVVDAIAGGRRAAEAIDRYLRGEPLPELEREEKKRIVLEDIKARLPELEKDERREVAKIPAERRRDSFEVVELGFIEADAIEEAKRCMTCGICADCRLCETACEADAISQDMEEEFVQLEVGAIIAATGYDSFDPSLEPNYGYEYDEVITSMEFERLCNASGPTNGHIEINGETPKEVVFISCVGSREKYKGQTGTGEMAGNAYCSRVCCMYIAKQAHLVREHISDANATVFYTDVRAFGKGFEEFYWRVKEEGVNYIRRELTDDLKVDKDGDGQLRVKTVSGGRQVEKEADLVVLATGIVPKEDVRETARKLKITQSGDKFFLEAHPKLRPVDTLTNGIFIAGCCQSPKDIPDTVAQASATASRACSILSKEYVEVEPITAEVDETLCCGCGICESVCPYGAIEVIETEEGRRARVTGVKCHGCGTCGSSCIKKAVKMHQFTDEQLIAQERAALATEKVVS